MLCTTDSSFFMQGNGTLDQWFLALRLKSRASLPILALFSTFSVLHHDNRKGPLRRTENEHQLSRQVYLYLLD